jgi:transposase
MNDFVIPKSFSRLSAISGQLSNRITPWEYDRALYKKRNEVERLFRWLKGFRRISSRFEKFDVVFLAFLHFALIVEALRLV